MGVLTSISRGLEAVSTPLGVLPDMVYAAAAVSFLLLLIVYVFVTPSWREKKRKCGRAICVWLMFAIYVLLILAVTISCRVTLSLSKFTVSTRKVRPSMWMVMPSGR